MDDARYAEIADRLSGAGFRPDRKEDGRQVRQRWRLGELRVTVDFLIARLSDEAPAGGLQNLTADLAAIVIPGLGLAFDEYVAVELDGLDLAGDSCTRSIRCAGPGAFTVLKALAFRNRSERKDAYDLCYVLRRWPATTTDVARRLAEHADRSAQRRALVLRALSCLASDFASTGHSGPRQAARFLREPPLPQHAADARGAVDDLLRACAAHDLDPVAAAL